MKQLMLVAATMMVVGTSAAPQRADALMLGDLLGRVERSVKRIANRVKAAGKKAMAAARKYYGRAKSAVKGWAEKAKTVAKSAMARAHKAYRRLPMQTQKWLAEKAATARRIAARAKTYFQKKLAEAKAVGTKAFRVAKAKLGQAMGSVMKIGRGLLRKLRSPEVRAWLKQVGAEAAKLVTPEGRRALRAAAAKIRALVSRLGTGELTGKLRQEYVALKREVGQVLSGAPAKL